MSVSTRRDDGDRRRIASFKSDLRVEAYGTIGVARAWCEDAEIGARAFDSARPVQNRQRGFNQTGIEKKSSR